MRRNSGLLPVALLVLWICPLIAAEPTEVQRQVFEREKAFARTMADRNLDAFRTFVAEDTIFFNGTSALRGREQVVKSWSRLYQGEQAPFSWAPDQVEVLDSGDLALSTGPVLNPAGECVGRFSSIWRLIEGTWQVVFDKGDDSCPEPGAPAQPQ